MEAVEYGTGSTGEAPGEGFSDSYHRLALTADSSADLVAVGEDTEALAGDKQSVTVQLRNEGPGWVRNQESDDQTALKVQIPPGTVAAEVPKECAPFGIDGPSAPAGTPGKSTYVCWPSDHTIEVGQSLSFTFMLDIKESAQDTKGEVKVASVYGNRPEFDKNPANDKAYISIDIPSDYEPGPATSGGSSTGGSTNGGSANGGSTTGGDGNDPAGQSPGGTGATSAGSSAGPSTVPRPRRPPSAVSWSWPYAAAALRPPSPSPSGGTHPEAGSHMDPARPQGCCLSRGPAPGGGTASFLPAGPSPFTPAR
jgi:hypothetical protein